MLNSKLQLNQTNKKAADYIAIPPLSLMVSHTN